MRVMGHWNCRKYTTKNEGLEFGAEEEMEICAGGKPTPCPSLKGGVFLYIPVTGIDSFWKAEIEGELGDDLPPETEVETSAETVSGRDGIGIKHIVLVEVDAIRPFAGVKELKSQFDAQRCRV